MKSAGGVGTAITRELRSGLMLLGRLEAVPVVMLLTRHSWRVS